MNQPELDHNKYLRLAGAILQAVIIGSLLSVAMFELFSLGADTELFRYQGF